MRGSAATESARVPVADPELKRVIASIAHTPIATTVTLLAAADNPLIAVNDAFCRLTGYEPEDAIGRNCRFLGGERTEPEARAALREAIAEARPALVELTNYRKDGSAFSNAVMIAPLRDSVGEVIGFVGSQMEVAPVAPGEDARAAAARRLAADLTPRQRQVLELMTRGRLNKEIAALLGISVPTVKLHRALLLKRLGAKTSSDAVRIAVEAGIGGAQLP